MRAFVLILLILIAAEAKVKKGQEFPSVNLKELSGSKSKNPFQLAQQQKLTLVDFWASWCKPCELSLPVLNEIYTQYKGKGLLVVGINVDEDVGAATKFAKKKKMNFPVLYDQSRVLVEKVDVESMPSSYLLDHQGKVIWVHNGFREGDREKILKEIKKVIK